MPDADHIANTQHVRDLPADPDLASEKHAAIPVVGDSDNNLLMWTRRLSATVTNVYDHKLRPFGIGAVQFSLLEIIGRMQPATRADIARKQELDKSTLTRNLKSIVSEGWVEEVPDGADGRSRPIALTKAGTQLLQDVESARRAAQEEVMALLRQQGFVAMDHFIAHANIDRFLSVLDGTDLTETNRTVITKLLIAEEDKLSHDLEQLEFAENRFARSIHRMSHLTRLRDAFADGSTDRALAEKVLTNFEVTYQLTERFYRRMHERVNGRGI